jgi:hypothetical protein
MFSATPQILQNLRLGALSVAQLAHRMARSRPVLRVYGSDLL